MSKTGHSKIDSRGNDLRVGTCFSIGCQLVRNKNVGIRLCNITVMPMFFLLNKVLESCF